jgi:hypothetical protein
MALFHKNAYLPNNANPHFHIMIFTARTQIKIFLLFVKNKIKNNIPIICKKKKKPK